MGTATGLGAAVEVKAPISVPRAAGPVGAALWLSLRKMQMLMHILADAEALFSILRESLYSI